MSGLSESTRVFYSIEQIVDDLDLSNGIMQKIVSVMDKYPKLKYIKLGDKYIASGQHILYAMMTLAVLEKEHSSGDSN